MTEPSAADLLRSAKQRHDITDLDLVARVQRDEAMPAPTAEALVKSFVEGGACPLAVAAALITIIADRKVAYT